LRAVIVMPTTPRDQGGCCAPWAPRSSSRATRFDEANVEALRLRSERDLTLIAPYDDPEVITGLGTIGMEILRQHRGPIDAIFVPVGGGGLIADIAAYVEALEPSTRIVGVEPDDAACLDTAIEARRTRARRYVRRRRRREIGDPCRRRGRTHRSAKRAVAHRPASRPRGDHHGDRRNLRGHQGRLRRQPIDPGARRRAGHRGPGRRSSRSSRART